MNCIRRSETNYRRAVATIKTLIIKGKDVQAACEAEKLTKYVETLQLIKDCTTGIATEKAVGFIQLLKTMTAA
jgi:hypothetical protein